MGANPALLSVLAATSLGAPVLAHDCDHEHRHRPDDGLVLDSLLDEHPHLVPYAGWIARDPALAAALEDYPGVQGWKPAGETAAAFVQGVATPGWRRGNTHIHDSGFCGTLTAQQILDNFMDLWGIEFGSLLVWNGVGLDPTAWLQYADPYLFGQEHPDTVSATAGLYADVEVSAFSASRWGHVIALNVAEQDVDAIFDISTEPGVYDAATTPDAYDWEAQSTNVCNGLDLTLPAADEWTNDGTGSFGANVLRHFQANEDAATGWAHQRWPIDVYADECAGGYVPPTGPVGTPLPPDPTCRGWTPVSGYAFPDIATKSVNFQRPAFAPFDVAAGLVDFLEASHLANHKGPAPDELCEDCVPTMLQRWYGLYYKLLTVGQRISISAGTDYPCGNPSITPLTHVKTTSADYDDWVTGLAEGRVSLSMGNHQFLDFQLQDPSLGLHDPGAQVFVDAGQSVVPIVTYNAVVIGPSITSALEILVDGEVAWSQSFTIDGVEVQGVNLLDPVSISFTVPPIVVEESQWIAARTGYDVEPVFAFQHLNTHAAAVYVVADKKPIVDAEISDYFVAYANFVQERVAQLVSDAVNAPGANSDTIADYWVGTPAERLEMEAHVDDGRDAYRAVGDYDRLGTIPNATLVTGTGSSRTNLPPLGIATERDPFSTQEIFVECFNAPPSSLAILYLDLMVEPAPTDLSGGGGTALLWLPTMPTQYFLRGTNLAGYADKLIAYTPSMVGSPALGTSVFLQWAVLDADPNCVECWSTSEVLEVVLDI